MSCSCKQAYQQQSLEAQTRQHCTLFHHARELAQYAFNMLADFLAQYVGPICLQSLEQQRVHLCGVTGAVITAPC